MIYYITVVHIGAVVGLRCLLDAKWSTYAWTALWYYFSGLGITAGAHRLWAHRSYKAARSRALLPHALQLDGEPGHDLPLVPRPPRCTTSTRTRRRDPHDSGRGFFFAHMGWLLVKKDPRVIEAGNKLNYDDLWADWTVVLQQKLNPWGQLFMCFAFPMLATMALNGETWFNAALHRRLPALRARAPRHVAREQRRALLRLPPVRRVDPADRELVCLDVCHW
ncbi:hypothetical protein PINS_up023699 [Pythium insidiosum]|nr:hypothetical protein PINS_up023699 [Pythium insidiosum]